MGYVEDMRNKSHLARRLARFRESEDYIDPRQRPLERGPGAWAGMTPFMKNVGIGAARGLVDLAKVSADYNPVMGSLIRESGVSAPLEGASNLLTEKGEEIIGDYAAENLDASPMELFLSGPGARVAGEYVADPTALVGAGAGAKAARGARNLSRYGDEGGDVLSGVKRRLEGAYGEPQHGVKSDWPGGVAGSHVPDELLGRRARHIDPYFDDQAKYAGDTFSEGFPGMDPDLWDQFMAGEITDVEAMRQMERRMGGDWNMPNYDDLDGDLADMVHNREVSYSEALEMQYDRQAMGAPGSYWEPVEFESPGIREGTTERLHMLREDLAAGRGRGMGTEGIDPVGGPSRQYRGDPMEMPGMSQEQGLAMDAEVSQIAQQLGVSYEQALDIWMSQR